MIYRTQPEDEYFVHRNATARDGRLTFKARGILAHILSLPPRAKVSDRELAKSGPDGRDAVASGLKELEEIGYLVRLRRRLKDGRFAFDSFVFDRPLPEAEIAAVKAGARRPWMNVAQAVAGKNPAPWPENPATEPWPEKPAPENPAIKDLNNIPGKSQKSEGKIPPPLSGAPGVDSIIPFDGLADEEAVTLPPFQPNLSAAPMRGPARQEGQPVEEKRGRGRPRKEPAQPGNNEPIRGSAAKRYYDPRKIDNFGYVEKGTGTTAVEIWLEWIRFDRITLTLSKLEWIEQQIGRNPAALDKWREVVKETTLKGWKPGNVGDRVKVFKEGWYAGSNGAGGNNGANGRQQAPNGQAAQPGAGSGASPRYNRDLEAEFN